MSATKATIITPGAEPQHFVLAELAEFGARAGIEFVVET